MSGKSTIKDNMDYRSTATVKAKNMSSVRTLVVGFAVSLVLIIAGLAIKSPHVFFAGITVISLAVGWFIYAFAYEGDANLKDARGAVKSNIISKYGCEDVYYSKPGAKVLNPYGFEQQDIDVLVNGKRIPCIFVQDSLTFEPHLMDAKTGLEL